MGKRVSRNPTRTARQETRSALVDQPPDTLVQLAEAQLASERLLTDVAATSESQGSPQAASSQPHLSSTDPAQDRLQLHPQLTDNKPSEIEDAIVPAQPERQCNGTMTEPLSTQHQELQPDLVNGETQIASVASIRNQMQPHAEALTALDDHTESACNSDFCPLLTAPLHPLSPLGLQPIHSDFCPFFAAPLPPFPARSHHPGTC